MNNLSEKPAVIWSVTVGILFLTILLRDNFSWLDEYPKALTVPVTESLNASMAWFASSFGWIFKAVTWLLDWPIKGAQVLLQFLPWTVTLFITCVLAYRASGCDWLFNRQFGFLL